MTFLLRPSLTRRDTLLFLVGACFMRLITTLYPPPSLNSIVISNHIHGSPHSHFFGTSTQDPAFDSSTSPPSIELASSLPETTIVHHAPGWTLFRDLYMSDGVLYLLSSESNRSTFPHFRMMTSTGVRADNNNMTTWEPTKEHMDFISPEEARQRWGGNLHLGERNRVLSIEGNTVFINDHPKFIGHFFHFVAETFFGVQAFWHGAFSPPIEATITSNQHLFKDSPRNPSAYPVSPTTIHPSSYLFHYPDEPTYEIPPIHRVLFKQAPAKGWRDDPGFDAHFLRTAYPGLTVEVQEDWMDRVEATRRRFPSTGNGLIKYVNGEINTVGDVGDQIGTPDRAFHFPLVLLVDRLSSFQGEMTGRYTQRVAAEAYEYMRSKGKLRGERVGGWWEPLRGAIVRWAGGAEADEPKVTAAALSQITNKWAEKSVLPMPKKVVVTYISRQGGPRRKLLDAAHDALVVALEEVCKKRGWELNVVLAEKLTKDEQIRVVSRTTFLLGVHGNGLTHLVFMPPTRISTVIEIFYPGGFAHDYHWTSRALGMEHFAVWNDTHYTYPNEPRVAYPEGFQGAQIPVHGPAVAKILEDRVDGKL